MFSAYHFLHLPHYSYFIILLFLMPYFNVFFYEKGTFVHLKIIY